MWSAGLRCSIERGAQRRLAAFAWCLGTKLGVGAGWYEGSAVGWFWYSRSGLTGRHVRLDILELGVQQPAGLRCQRRPGSAAVTAGSSNRSRGNLEPLGDRVGSRPRCPGALLAGVGCSSSVGCVSCSRVFPGWCVAWLSCVLVAGAWSATSLASPESERRCRYGLGGCVKTRWSVGGRDRLHYQVMGRIVLGVCLVGAVSVAGSRCGMLSEALSLGVASAVLSLCFEGGVDPFRMGRGVPMTWAGHGATVAFPVPLEDPWRLVGSLGLASRVHYHLVAGCTVRGPGGCSLGPGPACRAKLCLGPTLQAGRSSCLVERSRWGLLTWGNSPPDNPWVKAPHAIF